MSHEPILLLINTLCKRLAFKHMDIVSRGFDGRVYKMLLHEANTNMKCQTKSDIQSSRD